MLYYKIVKSGGHCYDGCGWTECQFWERDGEESRCLLFGGIEGKRKNASESLPECNEIFGESFEGDLI